MRDLVRNGMDCMRINCAHDDPQAWLDMIRNLRKAQEETGRNCRILMDVAGPKLRTGPIEPGPSVIKCRPKRNVCGRVVTPARIWLTPNDKPEPLPDPAATCIPLSASFLKQVRSVTDSACAMPVEHSDTGRLWCCGQNCWADAKQTIYFMPGSNSSLYSGVPNPGEARFNKLFARTQHRPTSAAPAIPAC